MARNQRRNQCGVYLERALAHMKQWDKVWFATGSEIIDAYQRAMLL